MNFSPAGATRPSTVIGPQAKNPLIGNDVMPPDAVTPGIALSRSHSSR